MPAIPSQIALLIQRIEELGRRIKASADEEEKAELARNVLELCAEWRKLEEEIEAEVKPRARGRKPKPDLLDAENGTE